MRGRRGLAYFPLALHGCWCLPLMPAVPGVPAYLSHLQPSRAPLGVWPGPPAGALQCHGCVSPQLHGRPAPRPVLSPRETRAAGLGYSGDLACSSCDWGCLGSWVPVKKPSPHFRPQLRSPVPSLIRPGENGGLPRALLSGLVQLGLTRGRSVPRTPGYKGEQNFIGSHS